MDVDPDENILNNLRRCNCNYLTVSEFCDLNLAQNNFSLLNYNIHSFHKNVDHFKSLLHSLNINFKCIVLTETWNTSNNVQLCQLPDYDSFHVFRPAGHIYSISGGISVFCDKYLCASELINLSICNEDIEYDRQYH